MERRLAALMIADVKDYSRLMEDDEEATVRTITSYREVFADLAEKHGGRVVGDPGDNILCEFSSVVVAMHCAMEIQDELRARNAHLPEHRRMRFRIGLNLGDVIVDGDEIYGDGVNVAARVEVLADPGGISVSGTVYDQVKQKLPFRFEERGLHAVKNISEPIRVYGVAVAGAQPQMRSAGVPPRQAAGRRRALVAAAAVLALGLASWLLFGGSKPGAGRSPSLAVLPFCPLRATPEAEPFCAALTNDLTTRLSQLPGLAVAAGASTAPYGRRDKTVRQVGAELGVAYVLDGHVEDRGGGWKVSAQLVDASTGKNVFAWQYEPSLTIAKDIGADLQEEIASLVAIAVRVWLALDERRPEHRGQSERAYEQYAIGEYYLLRTTPPSNDKARRHFERASELGTKYARAKAAVAETFLREWYLLWSDDKEQSLHVALRIAREALALDEQLAFTHALLGEVYAWDRHHDEALASAERAVELDGGPESLMAKAEILNWAGRPAEAVALVERAKEKNPDYPHSYHWTKGHALYLLRSAEAEEVLRWGIEREPSWVAIRAYLALTYVDLGRVAEARKQITAVLASFAEEPPPVAWLQHQLKARLPYADPETLERVVRGIGDAAKAP